jgi:hypothetical protein
MVFPPPRIFASCYSDQYNVKPINRYGNIEGRGILSLLSYVFAISVWIQRIQVLQIDNKLKKRWMQNMFIHSYI